MRRVFYHVSLDVTSSSFYFNSSLHSSFSFSISVSLPLLPVVLVSVFTFLSLHSSFSAFCSYFVSSRVFVFFSEKYWLMLFYSFSCFKQLVCLFRRSFKWNWEYLWESYERKECAHSFARSFSWLHRQVKRTHADTSKALSHFAESDKTDKKWQETTQWLLHQATTAIASVKQWLKMQRE